MGGGGGGSGGGAVVGGPASWAAMGAGYLNSQAAMVAGQQAEQAINEAINSINRNYQQARYDVQPYRTEGVQALNQLNQYLQLDPYNPGKAPVAPKENTIENAMSKITDSDIRSYIMQNISPTGPSPTGGAMFSYTGVGADNNFGFGFRDKTRKVDMVNGGPISANPMGSWASGVPADVIRRNLAEQYVQQNQEAYDIAKEAYDQNLGEYNQNLDMYNRYKEAGPLSAQQISEKITNLPGYQAQLNQGIDTINKASGAGGYLGSGRLLKELNQYGQNTLSTFYGNELSRLAGLAGMGQQAAQGTADISLNRGNALAGLQTQIGDIRANSGLASANALSQALLAANQQYKVIGGNQGGGGGGLGGFGKLLGGVGSLISAL